MDDITEKELNSYLSLEPFFAFSDKESESERQEFLDTYSTLPLAVKNIISGTATLQFLLSLGSEFQISVIKLEGLSKIIREILINKIYVGDAQNLIRDYLVIDDLVVRNIVSRIVSELFRPAINDIKVAQQKVFVGKLNQPKAQVNAPINQNNIIDLRDKKQ